MKKLLLLFAFLCVTQISLAQKKIETSVFILDLGKPTKSSLSNQDPIDKLILPTNKLLSLDLVNGNPYKYKYVINSKFVNFFDQGQQNFLDDVSKAISNKTPAPIGSTSAVDGKITEIKQENKQLKNDISTEKMNLERFTKLNALSSTNNTNETFTKNILNYENKVKANEKKIEELEALKAKLSDSKSEYSKYIIESNPVISSNLLINESDINSENVLNALKILKAQANYQKSDINKYILKISAEETLNKDEFITERDQFSLNYEDLFNSITILNGEAANNDIKDQFLDNRKDFDKTLEDIKTEIIKMYQLKFDNYTLPIDINGKNIDLVEITMQRFDKSNPSPTPDEYKYNIYIKGGLKIDISAGLFLTSLMDKEYETSDKIVTVNGVNETQKIIYEKQKGEYDFGFGSMINISLRGGSWIRPGLNFGALFTANQKFQILSGIGLALGKEERIIVHFGCSMGSVAEISSQYKADGTTPYNLGTATTVPTNDKFKFGHFFGITYNLSKQKKQTD